MKRVALVTGGSRGIGLGIAQSLLKDGFEVAICGVRPTCEHKDFAYFQCDVGNPVARGQMLDGIRQRFGRLHVLVNNAGITSPDRRDILEATEESFETVVRTNLRGPFFLTQAVARWMIEQKHAADFAGCIVNISSVSATMVSINRGDYCISKAGIAWRRNCGPPGSGSSTSPCTKSAPA